MRTLSSLLVALLAGCIHAPPQDSGLLPAFAHLQAAEPRERTAGPPQTGSTRTAALPAPAQAPEAPTPTYSLDVRRVPVEQLLDAIARDQRIDLDLHPGIAGLVSLSVFQRPLPELFERICGQAKLRCEFTRRDDGGARLSVMPDTPFPRAYRVDYVNLSRDMNSAVATSTQIATSGSGVDPNSGSSGGNASLTHIATKSANHFWETLDANIRALLRASADSDAATEANADTNTNAVVMNRETGVLMVFATAGQHRKVAEFIDLVQGAARQQLMVEATIVEVTLSDGYRQGIDWNRLGASMLGVRPRGTNDGSAMLPVITYLSDRLDVRLDWLETFGTVKVLSSPKLSVLNNQTALLKVVEEVVYFLVDASTTEYGDSDREKVTATTKPQSVSVGLVMALTPQIGRDGEIILGVRPTISSISGFKDDPNPSLGSIPNRVPQIRTREIESVLRLADGETAVLGGLMEDKIDYDTGRIPILGAVPLLGEIFTRRENSVRRTELIIFLRPQLGQGRP